MGDGPSMMNPSFAAAPLRLTMFRPRQKQVEIEIKRTLPRSFGLVGDLLFEPAPGMNIRPKKKKKVKNDA
jgi:hypothetical protein